MLEELAQVFITLDEDLVYAVNAGLALSGFVVALIVRSKAKGELERAPYFAFTALLFLLNALFAFIWALLPQALEFGLVRVLVSAAILRDGVLGYYFGVLALARSRDAFGTGGRAFLAPIPVANLVLFLKPSRNVGSDNRIAVNPIVSGRLGVAVGCCGMVVAMVASGTLLGKAVERNPDPGSGVLFMLQSRGLDATLKTIAGQDGLPVLIDAVTTLVRIEAEGSRLRRTYVVEIVGFDLTADFRKEIPLSVCAFRPFNLLMRAGATFEEVYTREDGSAIGTQIVDRRSCPPGQ